MSNTIYSDIPNQFQDDLFYYWEESNGQHTMKHLRGIIALGAVFTNRGRLSSYTAYIKQKVLACAKKRGYHGEADLEQTRWKKRNQPDYVFIDAVMKKVVRLAEYIDQKDFEAILAKANKQFLEAHGATETNTLH